MRARDRAIGLIVVAVVVGGAVAGCAASTATLGGPTATLGGPTATLGGPTATLGGPTTPPGSTPVAASPSGPVAVPSGRPAPIATASSGPSRSPAAAAPSASGPLPPTTVDAGLLAVLPESVGGARLVDTPEAAFGSVGDPSVARVAARLATGYAVSESGDDWAVVSVVALRPGAWSEEFYRDWRDSYSAAICEQEGGIGGRAVATIGGREVDIATCGALRTYHVHVADGDLVVSIASVGEARFGEQVMAGLRP